MSLSFVCTQLLDDTISLSPHLPHPQRCEGGVLSPFQHMCWAQSGGVESAGAPAGGPEVGQCGVTTLRRCRLPHGVGAWDAAAWLHPLHGAYLVRECVLSLLFLVQRRVILAFNPLIYSMSLHFFLQLLTIWFMCLVNIVNKVNCLATDS